MSGPPETRDRVAQAMVGIAAAVALANGAFMIAAPLGWYYAVPTVPATGPANTHFIADIGFAYLASGLMLLYALPALSLRWMAAVGGSLWLTLHGGLHIYEVVTGICSPGRFLRDAPGVLGPSVLIYAALGLLAAKGRIAPAGLPKRTVLREADRMIGADAAYLHEIAASPGRAFEKFLHFMPASDHRHATPKGPFNMARIGSTLVEDCSTCAMIVARAALGDGVPRETVNAALAGGQALEGDEALGFRFGQAIARQDEAESAQLGGEIEARFGRTVRLELAMVAAFTRVYPSVKRGLGLTTACSLAKLEV